MHIGTYTQYTNQQTYNLVLPNAGWNWLNVVLSFYNSSNDVIETDLSEQTPQIR